LDTKVAEQISNPSCLPHVLANFTSTSLHDFHKNYSKIGIFQDAERLPILYHIRSFFIEISVNNVTILLVPHTRPHVRQAKV